MLKRLLGHMRTSRFGLLAACVLPALGIGVHAPHASFVATYISSCSGGVAPSVRTKFTSAARPRSRPKSSPVDVYRRGHGPDRKYEVLGEVGVLAHSSSTGEDELTRYASQAARTMGGDAIVDVWWDDAAAAKAGEQGMKYLTANVVRWQ